MEGNKINKKSSKRD